MVCTRCVRHSVRHTAVCCWTTWGVPDFQGKTGDAQAVLKVAGNKGLPRGRAHSSWRRWAHLGMLWGLRARQEARCRWEDGSAWRDSETRSVGSRQGEADLRRDCPDVPPFLSFWVGKPSVCSANFLPRPVFLAHRPCPISHSSRTGLESHSENFVFDSGRIKPSVS